MTTPKHSSMHILAAVPTIVPEPTSLTLLAGGFALLFGMFRRRCLRS